MKINTPIGSEQRKQADEEYRRVAENQITFIKEAAKKIENGEPLEAFECNPKIHKELACEFIAAVLRGAADSMILNRPEPAGKPPLIPDDFIVLFPMYADKLGGQGKALDHFAFEYQVSVQALKKRLGKAGSGAERELAKQEAERWQAFYERSKRKT